MKEIIQLQEQMRKNLTETNKALQTFNDTCEQRLPSLQKDYVQHAQMLSEMKTDLEYITRKIR
jgi:hypothetical protein